MVTGANGFVGRRIFTRLRYDHVAAIGAARKADSSGIFVPMPDLGPDANWQAALRGCDVVVHCAARVHAMGDLAVFRQANVFGTLALARQAARAGVRRFVYLSSIKVNGESSFAGRPFNAEDVPAPIDPYGISKAEAETILLDLAAHTSMEVVIIRPPLVYGPGVKANFRSMMNWLASGIPLPFGAIRHNRRTLVGLDNLVDLIVTCIDHPAAANQVFLAGDGEDLSTTDLLLRLAFAMEVPARLLPVPTRWLELAAAMLGKRAVLQRLCGNLQVDISKARTVLGWSPPLDVDEGLRRTALEMLKGFAPGR